MDWIWWAIIWISSLIIAINLAVYCSPFTIVVCFTLALVLNVFLAAEHIDKFDIMNRFTKNSYQVVKYKTEGAMKEGFEPGMRNIVIRADEKFSAMIGFRLWGLFDHYGYVESDENGRAVVSTYMGHRETEFLIFVSRDKRYCGVTAVSREEDQDLECDERCPPHWYQIVETRCYPTYLKCKKFLKPYFKTVLQWFKSSFK
ncbi:MAG: hypothetical protein ABEJ24_02410 [Candidatus Magasanikbacteria bacterium]